MQRATTTSEIVLLGAGAAHLEALRRFALRPPWHARLTVISSEPDVPLPGTMPGLIRGDLTPAEACVDLGRLCSAARARLILADPVGLDLDAGLVALSGRPPIGFDILSVDLEGESVVHGGGMPLQPLTRLLTRLDAQHAALPDGARFCVVGGSGTAAPELALALAARWGSRLSLVLVSDSAEPVAAAPSLARRAVRAALVTAGVELVSAVQPGPLTDGRLALSDGSFLQVDAALWARDTAPPGWLAGSGLACDATGGILVDANQASVSHRMVFAAGDCAAAPPTPGRAAPLLAANLRRAAAGRIPGRKLPRVWPQPPAWPESFDLGGGRVAAWSNGVAVAGSVVGRGKAWRDRWLLRRFAPRPGWPRTLPAQSGAAGPLAFAGATQPFQPHRTREAGATEIPIADALYGAMAIAPPPAGLTPRHRRHDGHSSATGISSALVAAGAGDGSRGFSMTSIEPGAGLQPPAGRALVQSIISLTALNFPDLFLFGEIAAAHALSEHYAGGLQPWTALAIASLPANPAHAPAHADLTAMVAGARSVLTAEGCTLVNVRVATASEQSLGIALTSLTDPAHLPRRRALRAGDALLLTKPLGTGIILSAQACGEARGSWLRAATDAMRATNAAAYRSLKSHGMSACAAVNGAGLGGDLGDLLAAAGLTGVLWPEAIPLLPGIPDLLPPALLRPGRTRRSKARAVLPPDPNDATFAALLAAPEISGGLIAGVPGIRAEACLAALRAEGVPAAIIGVTQAAEPDEPRIRLERR